ncbi:MAG: phosphoheptose isomerase [Deltaproteobacteria bacterium]|nr:phosphoheptose isomerase [Deltaproteobacteria bacterium]
MTDFERFTAKYYDDLIDTIRRLDRRALRPVLDVLMTVAERGSTLWIAGNGGSAALADHTACEISKGTHANSEPPIHAVSLTANGPMMTALANDVAYDQVFSRQLEFYLDEGDALLFVSTSGNSPNVLEACRYARKCKAPTIAFVGYQGGELAHLADHVVHAEVDNCGIAEDVLQSVMHVLTQYIEAKRKGGLG